jgi:hypothetical protein
VSAANTVPVARNTARNVARYFFMSLLLRVGKFVSRQDVESPLIKLHLKKLPITIPP